MAILVSNLNSSIDVYQYITSKGIEVVREDGSELACLCPFHANSDSPAFYINKRTGLWICFNPSCNKRGSLQDLRNHFGDGKIRFSNDHSLDEIENMLNDEVVHEDEDDSWKETLEKIKVDIDENPERVKYLTERGFSLDTIKFFDIGYSEKKGRLVIPCRDEDFHVIGFIGRAVRDDIQPKYLYSKNFPRKSVLFNLQNAKKSRSVIVVEGSLDAMKIHQAGHANVVATLGAAVTKEHMALLNRFFDKIIIFSDNDYAGFVMRDHIIDGCYDKDLYVVVYDDDLHDPGDMTSEEINSHISSAKTLLEWCL